MQSDEEVKELWHQIDYAASIRKDRLENGVQTLDQIVEAAEYLKARYRHQLDVVLKGQDVVREQVHAKMSTAKSLTECAGGLRTVIEQFGPAMDAQEITLRKLERALDLFGATTLPKVKDAIARPL